MATRIQLRRGTATSWASSNPVLFAGEPAVETDTGKVKIGNGTSAWSALPYILDVEDLVESDALTATYVSPPKWSALPAGTIIAHRGGSLQVPEHTMEGYRVAICQGLPAIEQDVHLLADGGLGVMHDGTVDRMTTSTGNVTDHTSVSWKQLSMDASAFLGGGWPDGLRPPLFGEVLAEFGNRVLLCPEAKTSPAMGPMLDELERRGISKSAVLVQSFQVSDCQTAVARGWDVMWLGTTDYARAAAKGIEWIGPDATTVTAQVCTNAHAAGVKVGCYTANRRYRRDQLLAAGVDAVFSDDPVYLAGTKADRKIDSFARGVWPPGLQANNGNRGKFYGDGSWGWDLVAAAHFALHGYLRPTDLANFVMDFDLAIDAVNGGDRSRWASLYLGTTDFPFSDGSNASYDGYHLLIRANGQLDVFRVAPGLAASSIGQLNGGSATDLTLGAFTPYRLTVTPTTITLARRDLAEQVSVTNNAARGGYISFGRNAAAVRFKRVSIT